MEDLRVFGGTTSEADCTSTHQHAGGTTICLIKVKNHKFVSLHETCVGVIVVSSLVKDSKGSLFVCDKVL